MEMVEFKSNLKEIFPNLSDSELEIVDDARRMLSIEVPSNKVLINNRESEALVIQSNTQYLLYKVKSKRSEVIIKHNALYHKKFTALSRTGTRPSKAAIDSEIYATSSEIFELKGKIDTIDIIMEYLQYLVDALSSYMNILSSRAYYI